LKEKPWENTLDPETPTERCKFLQRCQMSSNIYAAGMILKGQACLGYLMYINSNNGNSWMACLLVPFLICEN
jgi:hypothetical protein